MKPFIIKNLVQLFRASVLVTLAMATLVARGQEHSHEGFPEDALLILEGADSITKQDCYLFVLDIGNTQADPSAPPSRESFWVKVVTSYGHGTESHLPFVLKAMPNRNDLLTGLGDNQKDAMAVFISQGSLDMTQTQSFNLKWWHVNHFHNFRCEHLKVHEHH